MSVIWLTSVHGTGKTEITQILSNQFGLSVDDHRTLMFDQLQLTEEVQTQDELSELSWKENYTLFEQTMSNYLSKRHGKVGVLVIHPQPLCFGNTYYPLPYSKFANSGVSAIVSIVAPPQQIFARIQRGSTYQHAAITVASIEDELRRNIFSTVIIARQTSLPAYIVSNADGELSAAVTAIYQLTRKYM